MHLLLAGTAVACTILFDEVALALVSLPWLAISYATWPVSPRAMASARIDFGSLTRAAWAWVLPSVFAVMVGGTVADCLDRPDRGHGHRQPDRGCGGLRVAVGRRRPRGRYRGEFLKPVLLPFAPLVVITAARSAMTPKRLLVVAAGVAFYVVWCVGLNALFEDADPGALPTEAFVALYGLLGLVTVYVLLSTIGHDWFWYLVR